MKTFDNLHLEVETEGPDDAGVVVFLAHCWAFSREDWRYQVKALRDEFGEQIRIVTWDHRGHGDSDESPRQACSIENLGRDLGSLIDELAPQATLVMAGHSIGGMTLMSLAETRPEILERVAGVAFVNTSAGDFEASRLKRPPWERLVLPHLPTLITLERRLVPASIRKCFNFFQRLGIGGYVFGRGARKGDVAITSDAVAHTPLASMVGFYEDFKQHDRFAALERFIGIPTKVIVGSRDRLTPPEMSSKIAASIPGSELVIDKERGHMLPYENDALISEALIQLTKKAIETAKTRPSQAPPPDRSAS